MITALWAYIKWCRLPRCNIQREVIPVHVIKTHSSTGIATNILNLSTKWRYVVSFMPWPLYSLGRTPWYLLLRSLSGLQRQSWCAGHQKISYSCQELTPGLFSPQCTALHCTDCAITAPKNIHGTDKEGRVFKYIINPCDANSDQF